MIYGDIGKGLGGCFAVMTVLSIIGIAAIIAVAWWLLSNISVAWGGP